MTDKLTDKHVGEIWSRALHGWRVYADEQELETLQLIGKLIEERARNGQSKEAFESIAKWSRCTRLEHACNSFGVPQEEFYACRSK